MSKMERSQQLERTTHGRRTSYTSNSLNYTQTYATRAPCFQRLRAAGGREKEAIAIYHDRA
jgi:hypothetical protein